MMPILSIGKYEKRDKYGHKIAITRIVMHEGNKHSSVYMEKKATLDAAKEDKNG